MRALRQCRRAGTQGGVARPEFRACGSALFEGVCLVIAVGPVCRCFPIWGKHFVPGRHATDHQIRLYMKFRQTKNDGGRCGGGVDQRCHGEKDPRPPSQKAPPRGLVRNSVREACLSLAHEPFAEDDGELGLGLEPFAWRWASPGSKPVNDTHDLSRRFARFDRTALFSP